MELLKIGGEVGRRASPNSWAATSIPRHKEVPCVGLEPTTR